MPKEETIELRHIRNMIGEREDLPSLNPRVSLTSRVRAVLTKFFGVPHLIHLYGALGLNKTLTLSAGENDVSASFSDGTYLYVGLQTSPGKVVKIDLSTFTAASTLTLSAGENIVYALFSDGTYLYAGLLTTPGKIVRINLNNFTKKDTLTLDAGENSVASLFSDGTYLYAGLLTTPGKIVKVDLNTFTSTSTLTLAAGVNSVLSLFSDNVYLYASMLMNPCTIVKININTFTVTSTLTLTKNGNYGSLLFSDGIYLYVGAAEQFFSTYIIKVDLNTFTELTSLNLDSEVGAGSGIYAFFSDGIYLYAGYESGQIVKVDISTFNIISTSTSVGGEISSLFSDGTYLYAGLLTTPGKIVRNYIIPSADSHQRKIDIIKDSVQSTISATTSNGNVGGTTLIDTSRTEADNYWNNMTILILGGASKGQSRKITGFANATNTITVSSAFSTQILSGQKYVILPYIASTATSTLTQADILSDATPFAGASIAAIKTKTDLIPADITTQLDTNIPNINTNTDTKVSGRAQTFTKTITSAANAGAVTVGTITTQPCVIESIVIHANAAQTADLISCPITGAAGVISFIPATVATQANLNATDKEVAVVYGSAGVSLKATKTIVITLNGTGATAVNLDVIITYRSTVSGGYIT